MSSRASKSPRIPGLPTQAELAYLAGLLDRGGGFTASQPGSIGLKIVGDEVLRHWLLARFGGSESAGAWVLRRQADLDFLLPRLLPYLTTRVAECDALRRLVDYLIHRDSYTPGAGWHDDCRRLMRAVADARTTGER